jgi:Xaa-Pro aminopeptidase
LVLITADPSHEPVLLVPDHLVQTAWTSCISDVRCWSQFTGGQSKGSIATVADTFADLQIAKGRVGLEIGPDDRPGMSFPFFEELKVALPGVQWADSTPVLKRLTAIKSKLEIEKFRTACSITCQALKVGLDGLKQGMSEKELAQLIALEMARLSPDVAVGRPWFIFVHASGRARTAFDGIPTSYRFQQGDEIYIDLGFKYQGYGADIIRCATIGPPSRETERYYNAGRDANMAAVRYLKPGIKSKELFEHWAEQVSRLGFQHSLQTFKEHDFDFLGHGIGLSTHELPLLNSRCEDLLEAGMTVAIEGNVFDQMPFTKTRHALKNEENVLVTETGSEWLTPLPNDLYVIER